MRPSQLNEPENEDSISELRRSFRTRKPNSRYANSVLTATLVVTTDEANSIYEPVSFEEAQGTSVWKEAMDEEIKALKQNET